MCDEGFTGGAINAITKSGTQSVPRFGHYYGYKPGPHRYQVSYLDGTGLCAKVSEADQQHGCHLGGPIIKNKLSSPTMSVPTWNILILWYSGNFRQRIFPRRWLRLLWPMITSANQGYLQSKSDKAGLKPIGNINEFNKFCHPLESGQGRAAEWRRQCIQPDQHLCLQHPFQEQPTRSR